MTSLAASANGAGKPALCHIWAFPFWAFLYPPRTESVMRTRAARLSACILVISLAR